MQRRTPLAVLCLIGLTDLARSNQLSVDKKRIRNNTTISDDFTVEIDPFAANSKMEKIPYTSDTTLGNFQYSGCNGQIENSNIYQYLDSNISDVEVKCWTVCTSDGYYLDMLEVYRTDCEEEEGECQPAVLFHGLFANMDYWFNNEDPGDTDTIEDRNAHSGGLFMVKKGYRVIVPNLRGSGYSKYHSYYRDWQWQYWDFSWGNVAYYDVPAIISFVYDKYGSPLVVANGHGSVAVAAAEAYNRCDMRGKIKCQVLMNLDATLAQGVPCETGGNYADVDEVFYNCNEVIFGALDDVKSSLNKDLYFSLLCNEITYLNIDVTNNPFDYNLSHYCGNKSDVEDLEGVINAPGTFQSLFEYSPDALLDSYLEELEGNASIQSFTHILQSSSRTNNSDLQKLIEFNFGTCYDNRCVYGQDEPYEFRGSDIGRVLTGYINGYEIRDGTDYNANPPKEIPKKFVTKIKRLYSQGGTYDNVGNYYLYDGTQMDAYTLNNADMLFTWNTVIEILQACDDVNKFTDSSGTPEEVLI